MSYDQHVAKLQKSFDEYRDSVITKWDEKLRVATGKFSSKSFLSRNQSMMSRIKQVSRVVYISLGIHLFVCLPDCLLACLPFV